jgi:hypothetical protein
MTDQEIINRIQATPFLNHGDKQFLLQVLPGLSPLDKIKLKSSLLSNQPPAILQNLQLIKAKFYPNQNQNQLANQPPTSKQIPQTSQQNEKKEGFLQKISSTLFPEKKPQIVSPSILTDIRYLGSNIPRAINENVPPLQSIDQLKHPGQLKFLTVDHITFGLNTNSQQILQSFYELSENYFDSIENVDIRRGYFMNYIQSSLFSNYLNTALTALKHSELQPRKVVLNMMHQINSNNLNTSQFEIVAEITSHLRSLVGV